MASTNKTTNYELSQFIGTDKPAWLADYNQDMSKIDAGMHTAQTTATGADGKADSNATKIGTLTNLTTDDKTSTVAAINEVDAHADTAQNTASSAYTLAGTANDKATAVQNGLTLTAFSTTTFTATGATLVGSQSKLSTATNAAGSVGKMYGRLVYDATGSTVTLTASVPFSPETNINIDGFCLLQDGDSGIMSVVPATFSSAGTVTITHEAVSGRRYRLAAIACMLFFTDFGD